MAAATRMVTAPMPFATRSIIPVVEEVFRQGARNHPAQPGVDTEVLGSTAAWAIYGAARKWLEAHPRMPAEDMAAKIESMVKPGNHSGR